MFKEEKCLCGHEKKAHKPAKNPKVDGETVCLTPVPPVSEGAPYTACTCTHFEESTEPDPVVKIKQHTTSAKREEDLIKRRLQHILDKPLSFAMLRQLEQAAHAAKDFLFISGDQDEVKDEEGRIDAEFDPPIVPLTSGSLDEMRNAFVELLRVLGKQEAFEELVKSIVKQFKITMK